MKNLYYLSLEGYHQTDIGVLQHLAPYYNITFAVIIPQKGPDTTVTELSTYCKQHNICFESFSLKRRLRDIRIGLDFLKVLKSIRNKKPDIIYTFCFDIPIIALLGMRLNYRKTIVFIHDVQFHSSNSFSYFLRIGRSITTRYFRYFQVFSKNQEAIFRSLYPKKSVHTIQLPLTNLGNVRNNNNFSSKNNITRFLFFGNILPYKGLEQLLEAVSKLNYRHSNFELIIAGRCENWETLYEPLIQNKNRVTRIIRHINNDEICGIFSNCHYLVLPYRDATQSGPLMLAYNYHLPVIASNIPAFQEVIENDTSGYLYDRNMPNDLELTLEAAILRSKLEYELLVNRLDNFVSKTFSIPDNTKKYQIMFSELGASKSERL